MVAAFPLFTPFRFQIGIPFFVLFLLCCQSGLAQSGRVDSLWQALSKVGLDSDSASDQSQSMLTQFTLLTDDDWRNFRKLFDQVHQGFIEYLSKHEAGFTPAEIRLLALLKLNLSSREIADTLAIALLLSAFLLGMCWQAYRHSVQENERLYRGPLPEQRDS